MESDSIPPFSLIETCDCPTHFSTDDYMGHLVDVTNDTHMEVKKKH